MISRPRHAEDSTRTEGALSDPLEAVLMISDPTGEKDYQSLNGAGLSVYTVNAH